MYRQRARRISICRRNRGCLSLDLLAGRPRPLFHCSGKDRLVGCLLKLEVAVAPEGSFHAKSCSADENRHGQRTQHGDVAAF